MADPKTQTACEENPKVGFGAYIALALAIIIFSGVCASAVAAAVVYLP